MVKSDLQHKGIKFVHGLNHLLGGSSQDLDTWSIPMVNTVDGRNPAPVDMVVYPIIYKVLYIPSGAGFLPSTVGPLRIGLWDACQMAVSSVSWLINGGDPNHLLFFSLPKNFSTFENPSRWNSIRPLNHGNSAGDVFGMVDPFKGLSGQQGYKKISWLHHLLGDDV